jgi:hypothetical protein
LEMCHARSSFQLSWYRETSMLHKMLRKIHRLGRELSATGLHPPKMALVS